MAKTLPRNLQSQSSTKGGFADEVVTVRRKHPGEPASSYTVRVDPTTSKRMTAVMLRLWREQRERVRRRGP
jgi:hypothetical protein